MHSSAYVRDQLVDVLRLDLIGPGPAGHHEQRGVRLCIAVSASAVNGDQRFPLIAVVPVTGPPGEGAPYPELSPGESGLTEIS